MNMYKKTLCRACTAKRFLDVSLAAHVIMEISLCKAKI